MAKLVSKVYGEALFELGVEYDILEELYSEVMSLVDIYADNPELNSIICHPHLKMEDKVGCYKNIFEDRLSKQLLGFIILIIEKNRYDSINKIFDYYIDRYKEYKNIGVAYVESALSIPDRIKKDIERRLLDTTKYTSIEINYKVNEALIGGMRIRIKDKIIDTTIQSKLGKLEQELYKIRLNDEYAETSSTTE